MFRAAPALLDELARNPGRIGLRLVGWTRGGKEAGRRLSLTVNDRPGPMLLEMEMTGRRSEIQFWQAFREIQDRFNAARNEWLEANAPDHPDLVEYRTLKALREL